MFAPIDRFDTVRMIMNGIFNEEVYVEQYTGFVRRDQENKVYRLKNALYGLKRFPKVWYTCIDTYFIEHDILRCPYKHTLYIKFNPREDIFVVCLYVDDLIFMSNNLKLILYSGRP